MRQIRLILWISFLGAIFWLSGCGPKQRTAEGLLDTPESHYNQGMRKLEASELDAAQAQFEDALYLKKKYAPAYAGLSLVEAERGAAIRDVKAKDRKSHFEKAVQHLDKAKDLKKKDLNVWIAHIRVHALWKNKEDWIKECEAGFARAIKINPRSDAAYYYMGMAYKQAFDFKKAEEMLTKAIDFDGPWAETAGVELGVVHKIVQARPGTKYGDVIALEEVISRADLAVLFIEEVDVVERVKHREMAEQSPDLSFQPATSTDPSAASNKEESEQISDVSGHWAESMIRDFVMTGLFELMPDHKFYPDEPVTRLEFAGAVQRLLVLVTHDQSLKTQYLGEKESHLRDLRTDHPLYGAAMLCIERNIMDLDKNGYFYPERQISGPDALLFIRDLKNALKW